jgi:hypothetical protein
MNKRVIISALLGIFFIVAAGCAALGSAGHKYLMKGQVLEVADQEAYLCIGSAEGAKPGQEFKVYRFEKTQDLVGRQPRSYKRELVGEVRIKQVVDEHFATATVLSGNVAANDVAELKP